MYKYAAEAGINMYLHLYQLCQQDEFDGLQNYFLEDLKHYNIYFVCQRNRVEIIPNSIKVTEKLIKFDFNICENDKKELISSAMNNVFGTTDIFIKSDYPYNFFELIDKKGEVLFSAKSAYVLDARKMAMNIRHEFLDFEVLYIGRTTRLSKKPTIDRLVQHSKLQKIYADTNRTSPNKEIYIVLGNFIQDGTIEVRGTIETDPNYDKEDIKRVKKFMKTRLELKPSQKTIITEAALIRYFQPKYNIEFKDSFPTKKHTSYKPYYDLDLNSVSIEMNTELHYFTKNVSTSDNHFKRFFLPTDSDRRKFLDFETDPPIYKHNID